MSIKKRPRYQKLFIEAFNQDINRIDFFQWGHQYASANNLRDAIKYAKKHPRCVVKFYKNSNKCGWAIIDTSNKKRTVPDYPSHIEWITKLFRRKKAYS